MPDAITKLKDDHHAVERLFKSYEDTTPRAHKTRRSLVDSMIKDLSVHAAIEEQVFYPTVRREVSQTSDEVGESLEEHHIVKWVLSELEGMSPEDDQFHPKVTVLIEMVRRHVEEEEGTLFPQVRETLGRRRLTELGDELTAAEKTAPTRPHPRSPNEPPLNVLAGVTAGAVDRAVDAVKGIAR